MYEVECSIRHAIEYHLLGTQIVTEDAPTGQEAIRVGSTARLPAGTEIAIYNDSDVETTVVCDRLEDGYLSVPALRNTWIEGTYVQPVYEGEFVQYVVSGNPPSIPRYPAITVECNGNVNDVLTLGAVGVYSQEFGVQITVWAERDNYSDSRRQVQKLASKVESALFKTVYPVVEPWIETTLVCDMEPEQNWFTVENGNGLAGQIPLPIYLSTPEGRYPSQITQHLGGHTFQMDRVFGRRFSANQTTVIRPRVHVYDTHCEGITLDENPDNLIYAEVSYSAKIARTRYSEPFI